MFKYKVGKRDEIEFLTRTPPGEAGEMLVAIQKMGKDDALFIPVPEKDKDTFINRYRSRLSNWRKGQHIADEVKIALTKDGRIAIYHGIRKYKKSADGQSV